MGHLNSIFDWREYIMGFNKMDFLMGGSTLNVLIPAPDLLFPGEPSRKKYDIIWAKLRTSYFGKYMV